MDIVIIGSGGLAKEVAFLIEDLNRCNEKSKEYSLLGFVDKEENIGNKNGKYSVVMADGDLADYKSKIGVVIGLGTPEISRSVIKKFSANPNIVFPNIIHPNAVGDWNAINMGHGNIICANVVFTTDIIINSFNIFNLSCTIGHDASIGSFNIFNPSVNISGGVEIEDGNLIGTGSQILQYLKIGYSNIVGAGAVVSKSIDDPGVYVGIPARKIKSR